MSKQIETKKIPVSNGQELIAEVSKWKNSGGEWKLLENYWVQPFNGKEKGWSVKNHKEGFKISNGKQIIEIVLDDYKEINELVLGKEWKELREIFPESAIMEENWRKNNRLDFTIPRKKMNKEWGQELCLSRNLNAWNITDIEKILTDYYVANQTEIDEYFKKNLEKNENAELLDFSAPWIEVDSDSENFYIWVGKREEERGFYRGDGELEITLRKSDLLNKCGENGFKLYDYLGPDGTRSLRRNIDTFWRVLTEFDYQEDRKIPNPHMIKHYKNYQVGFGENYPYHKNYDAPSSKIKEKILRNLDKICLDPIGYLANAEIINRENYEKNYYKGNPSWKEIEKKVRKVEIDAEEIDLINDLDYEDKMEIKESLINEIKQNPQDWKIEESTIYKGAGSYDVPDIFRVLRHKSGRRHWNVGIIYLNRSLKKGKRDWAEIEAFLTGSEVPVDNNQINDSEQEKKLILQYFLNNSIEFVKISPNGSELIIKYKSGEKKTVLANSQELFCLQNFIESKPNKSLSLNELQTNNSSTPSPNNNLAIGLTVGGIVLMIIIIFSTLIIRKRNKKFSKNWHK